MAISTSESIIIEQPLINSIPTELLPRFDPTFVEYYNKYNAGRLATHQIPIEDYRKDPLKYTISFGRQIVDQGDLVISEEQCPVSGGSITVRIFQPNPAKVAKSPRPVYINFHGGGWVFGGLATDFDFCKRVVHRLGCVAFDVDYRLSPEFKYPIPVNDCWTAFNWVTILSFHLRSPSYVLHILRPLITTDS
jgi:alpha/beta hydrolase fold